ncbi:hypothetical protein Tco_1462802 [Tanacetum coccineum]
MVINSPCLTDTKNWLFQCKRHLMQRLPSLMRLQMMLETRTTRFQIDDAEVTFIDETSNDARNTNNILLVIKKLTLKKLDD